MQRIQDRYCEILRSGGISGPSFIQYLQYYANRRELRPRDDDELDEMCRVLGGCSKESIGRLTVHEAYRVLGICLPIMRRRRPDAIPTGIKPVSSATLDTERQKRIQLLESREEAQSNAVKTAEGRSTEATSLYNTSVAE